jgi:HK97 family phage prohead protease
MPDFQGWATKVNIRCSDGRTIKPGAFRDDDGQVVPLVWQHNHTSPEMVLGHALLEDRGEGIYTYGYFNNSALAQEAKECVEHGDITALSIYANNLKQQSGDVLHGHIREVSLVMTGANPGACIINSGDVTHSDDADTASAIIYNDDDSVEWLMHSDDDNNTYEEDTDMNYDEEYDDTYDTDEEYDDEVDYDEILDSMTPEQLELTYALVGAAAQDDNYDDGYDEGYNEGFEHAMTSRGDDEMYSVFDGQGGYGDTLSHADVDALVADSIADVSSYNGSLKQSFLAHADQTYGIRDIGWLFPEPKEQNTPPEFIKRDTDWVAGVMSGVHKTPFSRIKTSFADITADEARAKGYIKGKRKKEEVFTLLKRTTTPTTIYKKQKLDRDDIVDITDFDVVAWIKGEMRLMLDEEIARAILVGDGRLPDSDDHINTDNIRPIWTDDDLYTIKAPVSVAHDADEDTIANAMIRKAIKSRKDYKGSGNPVLYTTESQLADMLLLEDGVGRLKYTLESLKQALRVTNIVTVPVMENLVRTFTVTEEGVQKTYSRPLLGIIVNLKDYNVGADKGGAVSMFDDFDINYNQQIYLIETRCSGALVKPYSAIVLELDRAAA